jgi:hypothetical protein
MFNKKLIGAIVIATIICVLVILYFPRSSSVFVEIKDKAVVVDGRTPDSAFNNSVTQILKDANFTEVHYIKDVTVGFYEKLPTYGYGLIILRIHSTVRKNKDLVDLFTNEPYEEGKYSKTGVMKATIFGSNEEFFAVGPEFVRETMKGTFENSVIIAMGCNGTTNFSMAEALKDKGASVYIGWNGWVDPDYTDAATELLLKYLLLENKTVADSVGAIYPGVWQSELMYYPSEIGNLKIRKKNQGIVSFGSTVTVVLRTLRRMLKTSEACMARRLSFEGCFLGSRIFH